MRSDRMKLERPHSERSEQTMSEKIVQLNEEVIKGQIKELVRGSVEDSGTAFYNLAEKQELEGIVAKRRDRQPLSFHKGEEGLLRDLDNIKHQMP